MAGHYFTSVTRRAGLGDRVFDVEPVARDEWATGQFVVGEVAGDSPLPHEIEVPSGRLVEVVIGDKVVGALGARAATLQGVGDWRAVGTDGRMEVLSIGGVIGRSTSVSPFGRRPIPLLYQGHVLIEGRAATMRDFVATREAERFSVPTVLIIGSSMDAGKTLAAKQIVRVLKSEDHRVAAAKLTGVGRFRDVMAMGDAGADAIFDFIDAGLPSTVVPADEYRPALRRLLAQVEESGPDVLVAEAGASPLEPYNGDVAVDELGGCARLVVLCASDPYAAVGVIEAFGSTPHLVSGRAASTTAGVELCEKLTGLPVMNLLDPDSRPRLVEMLGTRLQLPGGSSSDLPAGGRTGPGADRPATRLH